MRESRTVIADPSTSSSVDAVTNFGEKVIGGVRFELKDGGIRRDQIVFKSGSVEPEILEHKICVELAASICLQR